MSVVILIPFPVVVKLPYTIELSETIARAMLKRRYGNVCPQDYVEMVVESFKDDPIQRRKPRYMKERAPTLIRASVPRNKRISLMINGQHGIHYAEERGYIVTKVHRING